MLSRDLYRSGTDDRALAQRCADEREGEQGFLLLGLVVAIFLILLALGVAAPRVAHQLRREREVETVRRGNAYVRAIEVYYLKVGQYPGSIEQLEKTNNMRFLRKRYVDPMTGKDDWRLILVGQAKTTVKGFFGKPLGGIESSGLGSAAGMASPGGAGAPTGGLGSPTGGLGSSTGGTGAPFGSSSPSSGSGMGGLSTGPTGSDTSGSSGGFGGTGAGYGGIGGTGSSGGTGGSSGIGGLSASSGMGGTNGPFVGIGLVKEGNSIMTLNEQTTYPTWEFIYDPRIEQLKAQSSLFGGGMSSTNASSLGSAADSNSGIGGLNSGSNSGSGSQSGSGTSGFGNSGSGSFGGSTFGGGTFGSGSDSTPTSTPAPTSNSPQ